MQEFKDFLIKLFSQLANGDFTVMVECEDDKKFPADVIGYSEEYMTVKVRFHSDNLTKPGRKEVPNPGFGSDEETMMVDCVLPVKEENIWWESIKLKES